MAKPTLVSIAVTPANLSVVLNGTQQMKATGTYNDNSTQDLTGSVAWTSSNSTIATISATGLVAALFAGTVTTTATEGAIIGFTSLTITMPVQKDFCLTCVHHDITNGLCRALPPVRLQFADGSVKTVWPAVGPTDWCGSHKPTSGVD